MNKELKQRVGWRHLYKDYSLLLLSTRLRFKPKISYLIQILQAAQLLTLIIPPENSKELPWNYSHFSFIWEWVSISVRINYLFSYMGMNYINELSVLLLIISEYLCKFTLLYKIYKLRNYDLATHNLTPKLQRDYLIYLEQYSRYFLFELGYIPFLINILNFNLHFTSAESHTLTIMLLLLAVFMILCIEDSLFLQSVSWHHSPTSEFISDSRYILRKRVAYLVVLIISQFVNFKGEWYIYSAVFIIVGWYVAYKFGMQQPYGDRIMNCIEVCKGMMIFWGGIVMTLCVMNRYESEDITGTLVYLLVMPFIMYLSFHAARSRYEKLITSEEDLCQNQLFHILLVKTLKISKHEREAGAMLPIPAELETRIKYFSEVNQEEPFFVLWLVYFFQAMNYKISIKILISTLEYHLSSNLVFTYVNLLKNDLRELVINDPDENEAFNYICFTQNIAELLQLDEITCQSSQSFYRGLLANSPDSKSLSKLILKMTQNITTTENYYEYILSNFNRNPLPLYYYSGFLDIIKSSLKHKEVDFLAANSFDELKKRSNLDNDLKFFENDSCKMIVNLEQKNRGQILWITNANIYGYNDTFLTGTEFRQMIPEPVRKMHDAFFLKLFDIWSTHSVLTKNVDVFVLDKEGFIVASIYKARMTNLESGKLVVLAGLKPDKDGIEIAFLDQEGRYLLNLVRYI
jgi:hypothetical protein